MAGRIFYQELRPFNLLELEQKIDLQDHWILGGFPDSVLVKSVKQSFRWRASFIKSYIERDLPLLGLPLSPKEAYRLLLMITHIHGQLLNYSSIAKSMGVTLPTIKKYLAFLEHAFLITLLEPFHTNSHKRLIKSPKIYLRDSGLFHYLEDLKDYSSLIAHPKVGASWEAYVIEQVRSVLSFEYSSYFYKTQHGAELDLLVMKGNKIEFAIEIKFSASPNLSRGTYESMEDLNIPKLFVVIPTEDRYFIQKNIEIISLRLLMKELVLNN